ncbi:myosin heavy chain [Biomphalaria glabrata]|uniref:Myosin heavy chain, clone 203-like n=1 Tax=Biomphalaria glabrata TaxID=6526 RepID=A0A9U8E6L6_BIOGL|nr:myosin heavy chain, clone 203-like [Biomphalaria glabrata]KAI8762588.1 myosin heavy chain; 203-like [Biomphalaria glabrata]KAI8790330.1 myosin heavy chain [Biomphalaria glabrata]
MEKEIDDNAVNDPNQNQQSQRIPRELLHDQQQRLSHKHIKTLTFLQHVAKENKALKDRISFLEESLENYKSHHGDIGFVNNSNEELQIIKEAYLASTEEIKKLSSKHSNEIVRIQDEKSELERKLKEQILKMHHEIEALKAANNDLRDTVAEENQTETKQEVQEILKQNAMLENQNEELRNELESLREDLHIIQSKQGSEMTKLHDLKEENKLLKQNLQEIQQISKETEFRLDKALKELSDRSKTEEQETSMIEKLHEKVENLQLEYQQRLQFEAQMKQDFHELQSLKDDLMKCNAQLQTELENLLSEYGQLALDYNKLKKHFKQMEDQKSFKDFVLLKREVNILRDENDFLKLKTRPDVLMLKEEAPPHPPSIPKKKASLDGTRNRAKKCLAITSDINST